MEFFIFKEVTLNAIFVVEILCRLCFVNVKQSVKLCLYE